MLLAHDLPTAVLPIDLILVARESRQRKEINTADLEESLRTRGLINPILVRDLGDGTYELVAGERRLTTARKLGWTEIAVRFADGLRERDLQIIELEENIKRADVVWQDQVDAVTRIHSLFLDTDPEWTAKQTSEALGLTEGYISLIQSVAKEAQTRPELFKKGTIREAYNVIRRADSRKMGAALEELFEGVKEARSATGDSEGIEQVEAQRAREAQSAKSIIERTNEDVLNESFLSWAPSYSGPKFNLIHCDFPYGVELFSKEFGQRGGSKEYADSKDVYFTLLDSLLTNLDRIMAYSGHLVFWYSMKYDRETKDAFQTRAPSLDFSTHPFIWHKTDNAGIIGDARRDLRHVYEVALVARRGERQLVSAKSDVYGAPTNQTLHPSTKPEPMLRHLFEALVDEHTSLLDPTCGAGSSLRAAESLGAQRVLGLELDSDYCDAARTALRTARKLRLAVETAKGENL